MQPAEPFACPKPSRDCLSVWRRDRLIRSALPGPEVAASEAHLAGCAHCAGLVAEERALRTAAALEPVPPRLLQAVIPPVQPLPRARWTWWTGGGLAVACTMAALWLAPRDGGPDRTQLKGATSPAPRTATDLEQVRLHLSVQRTGQVIFHDAAADSVRLLPGDRLRLRLQAAPGVRARVEGHEADRWTTYFDGPLAADGWLPIGVTATANGQTRLRVSVCPQPDRCHVRIYDF